MSLSACLSDTQSFDLSTSQLNFNCNCMFYQNSLTYVPMEGKICNYCSLFTNTHKKIPSVLQMEKIFEVHFKTVFKCDGS